MTNDSTWPSEDSSTAGRSEDSSTYDRMCELCTLDESVIHFEPVGDGFGFDVATGNDMVGFGLEFRGATVCSGCRAVYDRDGHLDRALTTSYQQKMLAHEHPQAFEALRIASLGQALPATAALTGQLGTGPKRPTQHRPKPTDFQEREREQGFDR